MYGLTRGMLVNNPGNIRISQIEWRGKITPSSDPDFEQFATLGDGIHALLTTLGNYSKIHGLSTVAQIITRYAPQEDNNPTSSYVDFVAKHLGVDRNNTIDVFNPSILLKLASAIVEFEQGYEACTEDQIMAEIVKILPPTS